MYAVAHTYSGGDSFSGRLFVIWKSLSLVFEKRSKPLLDHCLSNDGLAIPVEPQHLRQGEPTSVARIVENIIPTFQFLRDIRGKSLWVRDDLERALTSYRDVLFPS